MGFDRTLPPPVFGVSTVPPVARVEGFCTEQINWRNDQQDKLTRRPKFVALDKVLPDWSISPTYTQSHTSFQDGVRHEYQVGVNTSTNKLEVLSRKAYGDFSSVIHNLQAKWLEHGVDLGVNTLDGDLYIWNRKRSMDTVKGADTPETLNSLVSLVNIISALNYAEEVTITAIAVGGSHADWTATYKVPGLTADNQEAADAARATNAVATGLAKALMEKSTPAADPSDPDVVERSWLTAEAKGSNIYVKPTVAGNFKLQLEVSTGRGDSAVYVKNYKMVSIDGMPKYCYPDVVRTVAPDPNSKQGRYYLKSEPIEQGVSGMQEVIWTETTAPDGNMKFADYAVVYKLSNGVIEPFTLKPREVGDDESNPARAFAGLPIQQLETFQDRLTILAGNKLNISKTDDYSQFWLGSALELLVTDPTDVGTSGNSSTLKHAVFHNRDLLIFTEDAQFKINGTQPVTPQTAAMPITTANECDLSVSPVLMGSNVYYANNYGASAGIRRFEVEANTTVDTSTSITDHIVGYMPGKITDLISNANQTMLVCRTSACAPNELFVFEQQRYNEALIYSWCTWRLRDGVVINDIDLYNEVITVRHNDKYYMYCDLKAGEQYPIRDVSLDQFGSATIKNNELRLPGTYFADDVSKFKILVAGNQRDTLSMLDYDYHKDGQEHVFTMLEDLEGTPVFYGFLFESVYEPTRPYIRERDGTVRTTDRLRVAHYILELSNTYRLKRRVLSPYWDLPDEDFTSLDSATDEFIDNVKPFTGQWRAQIGMNADDCTVQFIDDSPYMATIASIAYRAQSYSTRTRR